MTGAIYPDLANQHVLITGGATGIGEAIVEGFVRQKSKVSFIDIQDSSAQALIAKLRTGGTQVEFFQADLTDTNALKRAVQNAREKFGPVQVLVNNAAHDERHAFEEVTPEYFDQRIAVNLKHQFFTAQTVIGDMKAANAGSIINFSSTSYMIGQGGMAVYTMSKAAVTGLTRSLARDYGSYNIRVNSLAPGWIRTKRQEDFWITPESEKALFEKQCLKRWLLPDEIAKFTVFLASSEASACTNQMYVVDGGWV